MEDMAGEWGYSLFDALNKYSEEPHVEVFLNVVKGEGTEHCFDVCDNKLLKFCKYIQQEQRTCIIDKWT